MFETNEKFVFLEAPKYIHSLNEDMEAKWGKMTAHHMVEHLGIILLISGNRVEAHSIPKVDQEKHYKNLTSGSFHFKKNTVSPALPEDPLPLRFPSLSKAKEATIKALKSFKQYFEDNPDAKVEHPVFGKLNYNEWLFFHEIHLKHHFRQFGLIN